MKKKSLPLLLFSFFIFTQSYSQYSTPSVTSSGVYYMAVHFNLPPHTNGITGGTQSSSGSQGYADNSGSSWGTIRRDCGVGLPYNVYNPAASAVAINMRVFIDWNGDFDFDDTYEMVYDFDFNLNGVTSVGTGASWVTPSNAPSTVRVRFAVRQGGSKATAYGGYTGEIEDYTMTIAANTAPSVNGAATGFINPLAETQTNNDGITTQQFFTSSLTGGNLTTDGDNCARGGYAITGTSGSNGQWQFKIGNGSWTNFGAVSTSNALLLHADNTTRIRFVPTGPGTPGFTYRAWDRSSSSNGQYADISSSGGATAFSTGNSSASTIIYSVADVSSDITIFMASADNPNGIYNIKSTSLTPGTGILKNPESITTDDLNGFAYDIAIDPTNNKLVWAGGSSFTDLYRSDFDGSNQQAIVSGFFSWPTGVAAGGNKLFIIDGGLAGIYSCNPDGSGITAITGGAGQANDIYASGDIEYANNKIYYINSPDYVDYNIMQANPDGTGTTTFYTSTTASPYGLAVTGTTLYWTEYDGADFYIKSKPLGGGAVTTLFTTSSLALSDFIIDEINSRIYFQSLELPGYNKSRIQSIPLSGGSASRLLDLEYTPGGLAFNMSISTLPVHFINVNAQWQNNRSIVEWKVGIEENVQKYIVQRSADGRMFTDAGTVTANRQSNYGWTDTQPFDGKNYYRIKAVDIDEKTQYSNIVMVNPGKSKALIAIYPTIVTGGQINLKLENADAGKYQLMAINASGQQVFTKTIMHGGGSSVQNISLPAGIPAGIYKLKITSRTESQLQTIIVR